MPKRDVIVVGTSAGGLEALKTLVSQLPPDFSASLFLVWHMPPDQPSVLPQILERCCALPVRAAINGEEIQPGHIYVATPNHHLVLEAEQQEASQEEAEKQPVSASHINSKGHIRVTHGPKENLFRPSVDVLFRSAARAFGPRVIGVVLTGMLDDGASGLYGIKHCGGMALVQDPVDALFPDMPINAMKAVKVDYSVPVSEMGKLLVRLASENNVNDKGGNVVSERMDAEVRVALEDNALEMASESLGEPSLYTCPECHGVLTQIKEGPLLRFRCHTGHAYSLSSLLSGISSSVEDSLWSALRAIEETQILMAHMGRHLEEAGELEAAHVFQRRVEEARQRAELVRQAVLSTPVVNADEEITKEATKYDVQ